MEISLKSPYIIGKKIRIKQNNNIIVSAILFILECCYDPVFYDRVGVRPDEADHPDGGYEFQSRTCDEGEERAEARTERLGRVAAVVDQLADDRAEERAEDDADQSAGEKSGDHADGRPDRPCPRTAHQTCEIAGQEVVDDRNGHCHGQPDPKCRGRYFGIAAKGGAE